MAKKVSKDGLFRYHGALSTRADRSDTDFYRFHDVERLQGEKGKHRPYAVCHIENNAELFAWGNVRAETMFGNTVTCFSKEKMIVERMRKRKDYDSELFLKAVKTFLKGKDKDMDFLFPYAKKRKIEEKAYPILEAMDYEDS